MIINRPTYLQKLISSPFPLRLPMVKLQKILDKHCDAKEYLRARSLNFWGRWGGYFWADFESHSGRNACIVTDVSFEVFYHTAKVRWSADWVKDSKSDSRSGSRWEREGRSALLEADTLDVLATVGEFEKHLWECAWASLCEDVRPHTLGFILETDESEEGAATYRAFCRIVGEVYE